MEIDVLIIHFPFRSLWLQTLPQIENDEGDEKEESANKG